jgi:hypothetical protein
MILHDFKTISCTQPPINIVMRATDLAETDMNGSGVRNLSHAVGLGSFFEMWTAASRRVAHR